MRSLLTPSWSAFSSFNASISREELIHLVETSAAENNATVVYGCIDAAAVNYDPAAMIGDGSCVVLGCTNANATNFDASATANDGSCLFAVAGCTDPLAVNHDDAATVDDGSCEPLRCGCTDSSATNFAVDANFVNASDCDAALLACEYEVPAVEGCTDPSAANYDPSATIDDGLCAPLFPGCTSSLASNYAPAYNQEDGSCRIAGCTASDDAATFNVQCICNSTCAARRRRQLGSGTDDCWDPAAINYWSGASGGSECAYNTSGCTDSTASNYLPIANIDDGGCRLPVYGCTDATALNFDSTATVLEGCVATYPGCTDSTSSSYVASANTDDGGCAYEVYGCTANSALNFDSDATVSVG